MQSTSAATLLSSLAGFLSSEAEGTVSVGYSGGADSGLLLWALAQTAPGRVRAVHVDHGWRPEAERAQENALVGRWCAELRVPLDSFAPPETVERTEAGARAHRYACFAAHLAAHPGTLYLAHHADDQAETVLMRLVKGRSWQGLGGMTPRRGPYRRPLLRYGADELKAVAAEVGVPFHTDSSNSDLSLARNFLRHRVFPQLKERFPRVIGALGDFAEIWRGQEAQPSGTWERTPRGSRVGAASWDAWTPLKRQSELLALASGSPGLTRRFLETVCADSRKGRALGGGWEWRRTREGVFWGRVAPTPGKEYFVSAVRGRMYDLGSYRLTWNEEAAGLSVPGVDGSKPWFWRSATRGMEFLSQEGRWTRDQRRRRLGALDPGAVALAVQDGLIRAVVAPLRKKVIWSDSSTEKLHNHGIFVTLVAVTPISTE